MMEDKLLLVLLLPGVCVAFADTRINTTCSNHFSQNVSVVTFCAESHATGGYIIMDGYYVNTITDKTCSCIVKSNKNQDFAFKQADNFNLEINQSSCGSNISVQSQSAAFFLICSHIGSTKVKKNEEIRIKLYKIKWPEDTRYCLELGQSNSLFDVSCFGNNASSTKTVEETTVNRRISSDFKTPDDQSTTVLTTKHFQLSSENTLNTTAVSNPVNLESNSTYMYVGIGLGCGAVLAIALVVAACLHYKRRAQKSRDQSKKIGNEPENHDEEDELHYNVLYTSSTDSATNSNSIEGTKISYCTEDTYHTIDMEETAATSKNYGFNQSTTNAKPSIKPDIVPKPMTTSVKHVVAPGENGSKYAVVQKTGSSGKVTSGNNVEDNTYSVVDKKKHTSNFENITSATNITDNTYAVVDKKNKRLTTDSTSAK